MKLVAEKKIQKSELFLSENQKQPLNRCQKPKEQITRLSLLKKKSPSGQSKRCTVLNGGYATAQNVTLEKKTRERLYIVVGCCKPAITAKKLIT